MFCFLNQKVEITNENKETLKYLLNNNHKYYLITEINKKDITEFNIKNVVINMNTNIIDIINKISDLNQKIQTFKYKTDLISKHIIKNINKNNINNNKLKQTNKKIINNLNNTTKINTVLNTNNNFLMYKGNPANTYTGNYNNTLNNSKLISLKNSNKKVKPKQHINLKHVNSLKLL